MNVFRILLWGAIALGALVVLFECGMIFRLARRAKASQKSQKPYPMWKKVLFSEYLLGCSPAVRIANISVMCALCIVSNMLEFRFADIQFSLTIFTSILTGMLLGPVYGFFAAYLGDLVGYLVNSWGLLYMPWVGLSCALMAAIAGLALRIPLKFRGGDVVRLLIISVLVLAVCSVGVNTTGFYLYYTHVGFSAKAMGLIEEHFGGLTYLTYALVRLVFMGQLWNNLLNFALLFLVFPALRGIHKLATRLK